MHIIIIVDIKATRFPYGPVVVALAIVVNDPPSMILHTI